MPSMKDRRDQKVRAMVEFVFGYWMGRCQHPRSKLDPTRAKILEARLKENDYDVEELLYVIDGAEADTFRKGTHAKSDGKKWDGIEYIFRSRARVEELAESVPEYRQQLKHDAMDQWHERLAEIEIPLLIEPNALRIVS